MTEIKIKRLSLENFKCHKNLTLAFDGGNASIYGDNATGKTSVYDAITWLLFGKDSQGNGEKNIEIKPLDGNGEVKDHLAVTAVEAVLLVNGEEKTLRRTYKEVWSTKRGSSQASYDGNTSEYFIDGVPCKRNAFQDEVSSLVSEDTFRMLTSVSHFAAQISWQDRRGVLFQVAGVEDDKKILSTSEQFHPLVESMGRLSLEDYKKKLLAEKRKYSGAKTDIPARISECQKTIDDIGAVDFAAAKAEVEALNDRKDGIRVQILQLEHNSAADRKRLEIREVQLDMKRLEDENKAYRASQLSGIVNVSSLKSELSTLEGKLVVKKKILANERAYITSLEEKIGESRGRWISVNSETFTKGKCNTCGQPLPPDMLKMAQDSFEAQKRKRLQDIEQTANSHKDAKAQAEDRENRMLEEIRQIEWDIQDKQKGIAAAEGVKVEIHDIEGYTESRDAMADRVTALHGELSDIMAKSYDVKEQLRREQASIQAAIDENMAVVGKESLLAYTKQRIEELREDARNAAECLDSIEKMLFLMDEYSRYKTRFVEDSINGLFRIARFRLFREQANGGVEDRCDVVHDGVPYISVNNGMKINLGIDIINTLSMAYGVRVPLFVDNAESVTQLESSASQIIRLVVSENDKELRVKYEN